MKKTILLATVTLFLLACTITTPVSKKVSASIPTYAPYGAEPIWTPVTVSPVMDGAGRDALR
jgi:outer membrane biogenesis lipoprotein LolB